MARPDDRHLTPEELETLLATGALKGWDSAAAEDDPEGIHSHAAACDSCRLLFASYAAFESRLASLKSGRQGMRQPACPSDEDLQWLAAGMLSGERAEKYMQHAANCDHCGPLLKSLTEDFVVELSPAERSALQNLKSSDGNWQHLFAGRLSALAAVHPVTNRPAAPWWSFLLRPRLAWSALGAAAAVAVIWLGMDAWRAPSPQGLLAKAYTDHRTLETRIAGASYAPIRIERGSARSNLDKPPSLLKAEALISDRLRQHPNDPVWLGAMGRADLLDGNYESAIQSLNRALELQPASADFMIDLASAYFERASALDRPIDYGNAIESLGKVLAKSPDNPVALFNRALICQRTFIFKQATEDWEHYLRVDPRGAWAAEARARLEELQKTLKEHNQSESQPLLAPHQIAQSSPADRALADALDRRIEEYLEEAVLHWLPASSAGSVGSAEQADLRSALQSLAFIANHRHHDIWLEDLLSSQSAPDYAPATVHLARALRADEAGDNETARVEASAAERLFDSSHNGAGALRAHVEYLFASHDAQESQPCMSAAKGLAKRLGPHSYPWLATEFHIELGTCNWLAGNVGESQRLYAQASEEALAAGYNVIYLRAQDHLSGVTGEAGGLPESWTRTRNALSRFWSGPYPPMRGYNLYYNLYEFSRAAHQPHLQVAVWQDGVQLSQGFTDNVLRAMAHSAMSNAAFAADDPLRAENELATAAKLFGAAPQIKSTRIDQMEVQTRLAEMQIATGRSREALSLLRPLEPQVSRLSDDYLAIMYYTVLGEAESRAGSEVDAESALRSAVSLSESHLRSLRFEDSGIQWRRKTSGTYRNFVQLRLRQARPQDALEIWESYLGSALRVSSRNRAGGGEPALPELGFQDVSAWLARLSSETVISYALLPGGLAVWVYDDRGVFAHWSEMDPARIEMQMNHFRELCSNPNSNEYDLKQNARSLYLLLIAPIERHLTAGRQLVIELDEKLSGFPFEALLDGHDHFLSDRGPIVYSLGASFQRHLRDALSIKAASAALVVAVPTSNALASAFFPPLPDAVSEGASVAENFHSPTLLVSEAANTKKILSDLPKAAVFHFAGHAMSSTLQAGLLLADTMLAGAAIQRTPLSNLQLAVLSACDTQSGSGGGFQDADSLVRVFLRAGVPHVVASRWSVDSAATRQFMNSFYASLLAGNSVSGSVHLAQLRLRSLPGMAHPFYWTAFTAFGSA